MVELAEVVELAELAEGWTDPVAPGVRKAT